MKLLPSLLYLFYLKNVVTSSVLERNANLAETVSEIQERQKNLDDMFSKTGKILNSYLRDSSDDDDSETGGHAGQQVKFLSHPDIILTEVTPSLTLNCSFYLNSDLHKGDDVISEITSIAVSKEEETIATYRQNFPAISLQDEKHVVVEGKYNNKSGHLTVFYTRPSSDQAGRYQCVVSGFDRKGYPHILTTTLHVTENNYQQLIERFEKKFDDESTEIVVLQDKINKTQNLLKVVHEGLEEQTENTEQKIQDLKNELKTQTATSTKQQQRISELESKLDSQENKIQQLAKELEMVNKQVYFSVHLTANRAAKKNDVLIFNKVITNEGQGYDTSTGSFLTPVSGVYKFSLTLLSGWNKRASFGIYQNDVFLVRAWGNENNAHTTGSTDVIVHLDKGDKINVKAVHDSNLYGSYEPITSLTGHLLHADWLE